MMMMLVMMSMLVMMMILMVTMMMSMMVMVMIPHAHDLGHVQLQPHVRGGVRVHGGAG